MFAPGEPLPPAKPYPRVGPSRPARRSPRPRGGVHPGGRLWTALIPGFLILIVLLIFIAPEHRLHAVHVPDMALEPALGVAILLAAVGGGLITARVSAAGCSSCAARRRRICSSH